MTPEGRFHIALLFPGQGSQTKRMRDVVAAHRPDLLSLATDEVGTDPFPLVDEGTRYAQPAMFCASLAGWERAGRPPADVLGGHSLGELAALVAAGSLEAEDGLRVAVRRGELMQAAAEREREGGMLALLGNDAAARRIASEHGLTVANDNAPGQLVLSGPDPGLEKAVSEARDLGLKAMRLPIRGAFHSPAMRSATPEFRAVLDQIEFGPPEGPVFSSTTARPFGDIRATLAEALTHPVRWRDTMLAMRGLGVTRFLESGPGKVLTNIVRRTLDGVEAKTLDSPEAARA
jgi:[acyl-carrier-protein] S-malonyltransferase